ncbi:MAG: SurA N-terminal domain-containing protein [Chlamydiia bacterium]|nr:SurA N-terminal domain-containing protein [Chlamydiia bacterium]
MRPKIEVNNRILANVQGKPITVIDVQKKMDLVFYRQFPQYANLPEARQQFYETNWRHVLNDLVDKELMLADAEENKITVNNGEVRKELEKIFGPNVIENLKKANLTYNDTWELIKGELIIRKLLGGRVHVKALRKITPKEIRAEYDRTLSNYYHPAEWTYSLITIRDPDNVRCRRTAERVHYFLTEGIKDKGEVDALLAKQSDHSDQTKISFSETYTQKKDEVSGEYLEALSQLKSGQFSRPIEQVSRRDNSKLYRIFIVTAFQNEGHTPFKEVESKIKGAMTEKILEHSTQEFLTGLRKKYRLEGDQAERYFSDSFSPFQLVTPASPHVRPAPTK